MSKTLQLVTTTCLIVLVACFVGCPGQPEPTVTPKGAPPEKKPDEAPPEKKTDEAAPDEKMDDTAEKKTDAAPPEKKTDAAGGEEIMLLCGSSFSPPVEKLPWPVMEPSFAIA